MSPIRTVIMGAAGRDFHNFNVVYRDNPAYDVVAFTAAQIPNIDGRKYPASLAGRLYPKGIPILAEADLEAVIRDRKVQEVVFSYSDVSYAHVLGLGAVVNAAGAHFKLLGAGATMLKSAKPVIAVCAVRTGSGKSQTTRRIARMLREQGFTVAAVRHPMPYGNLERQRVQRYAALSDLKAHRCTIEEIEEYEPHIVSGTITYAGVDYGDILAQAQEEADVILWDGGNNDTPFYRPDVHIVVADPLRVGHELAYYPGETNLRMADAVVINKVETAGSDAVNKLRANIRSVNRRAVIVEAASPVTAADPSLITGRRVLVVEDGPTLTHGEMTFGAGIVAAGKFGAAELVDPRPYTVGTIAETFRKYPGIGVLLPAMGYGDRQVKDLETTINRTPCDTVIIGTPIDLNRLIAIKKPTVRVTYELQEIGKPDLADVIAPIVGGRKPAPGGRRKR
ncbi:MAG TPA: cyclic 2,3-diphosphoglycerate synthase [Vicinamibacterales bacterium]|nr:cyclic 2,3-diphosphoglycerate synthase [Vicinamibacterales bacterium]HPK70822.1 cyclic 2,3-diphosphoglycerate synthase [Vicinamibacterales bacterium]